MTSVPSFSWDPTRYLTYSAERGRADRGRPFLDLLPGPTERRQ